MIEWTRYHYSSSRPSFRSPAIGCGAEPLCSMEAAFKPAGSVISWHTKAKGKLRIAVRQARAQAIVEKLGGRWAEGFPERPKEMHHRTYRRLVQQYEYAEACSYMVVEGLASRIR